MSSSVIKQSAPLKCISVSHAFTFSNSQNSATVSVETLTNNIVTASMLRNVVATAKGGAIYAGVDGSGNIFLANRATYTGTLTANLLIYYS